MEQLVSIIVPVYNAVSYLEGCVRSVQKQTEPNWELILVDDGSSDGSAELADRLSAGDNRIRVIHQKNQGVSAARNAGLRQMKGQYCAFVDGDDTVMPDYLETALKLLQESRADFAALSELCPGDPNWPDGLILKDGILSFENDEIRLLYLLNHFALCEIGFGLHGKLFQTSFLLEHELTFPEGIQLGEDLLFLMCCLMETKKLVSSSHVAYCYYQREKSLMEGQRERVTLREYDSLLARLAPSRGFWREQLPVIYMRFMDAQFRQKPAGEMVQHLPQLQGCALWHEMVVKSCHSFGKFIRGQGLKDGVKLYLKICLYGTILGDCPKPYDLFGRAMGWILKIEMK